MYPFKKSKQTVLFPDVIEKVKSSIDQLLDIIKKDKETYLQETDVTSYNPKVPAEIAKSIKLYPAPLLLTAALAETAENLLDSTNPTKDIFTYLFKIKENLNNPNTYTFANLSSDFDMFATIITYYAYQKAEIHFEKELKDRAFEESAEYEIYIKDTLFSAISYLILQLPFLYATFSSLNLFNVNNVAALKQLINDLKSDKYVGAHILK